MTTLTSTRTDHVGRRGRRIWINSDMAVSAASHALLMTWSAIVMLPFLWVLLSSFKSSKEIFASPLSLPTKWTFDNYKNAWTDASLGRIYLNTLVVVIAALFMVMLLGSMCSYVLARFQFPGRRLIYYLILAGLTFPVFLAIVPLVFIMQNFGLLGTLPGLTLSYVAFGFPFTVFLLYAFFKTLPGEVYEAAQLDGAGEWRTFFSIMLPMARPAMVSVAIVNFLGYWNQFLLPVALNADPKNYVLTQGMAIFASQAGYSVDFGALFAAVVMTVLPVLIAYLVFQRRVAESVAGNRHVSVTR